MSPESRGGRGNKTVGNVMLTLQSQIDAQQQFLLENTRGSVENAMK